MNELIISMVLTALTTIVIFYISIKMYRSNVLIYSDKGIFQSFKQSLKLQKELNYK